MSIEKVLRCNGCGIRFGPGAWDDESPVAGYQLRADAQDEYGWERGPKGEDYCPVCAEKVKKNAR